MLSGLYDWMRQIIVFLLVTELLVRLTKEKYHKYLRLAVGLCLMFLVSSPLLKTLSGMDFAQLFQEAQLRTEFMPGKVGGEEAWRDGVLAEYEAAAKKQLTKLLKGLSLSVEKVQFWLEDGVIEGMSVWVREIDENPASGTDSAGEGASGDKENNETGESFEMGKISITQIVIALDQDREVKSDEAAVTEFVARMRIADFYDMDISHINVIKEE